MSGRLPSSSYQRPSWCALPSKKGWKLIEIKGGVEVASYELDDKSCIILGRAADAVDIVLQHESCSRRHARIAFDREGGTPWLKDLGSAHGTKVNRKSLPPQAIGSTESDSKKPGSRGVIVYPQDLIQFGASTRLYCLEGPQDYERGAATKPAPVNNALPDLEGGHQTRLSAMPVRRSDLEAEYGEDEDTIRASAAEERSMELQKLDPVDIPERHRKLWERMRARHFKLANVAQESERIRSKGELTEGQQNQLTRNADKEKKLLDEIEEIERELHQKLFAKSADMSMGGNPKKPRRMDHDDDVDDFFDRTKEPSRRHRETGDGETEESLVAKWKYQQLEWTRLGAPVEHANAKVAQFQERLHRSVAAADDDPFFIQNDLALARDELRRAVERKESMALDLKETERLLRVVNDKLVFDQGTGYIGTEGLRVGPASLKLDKQQDARIELFSGPPVAPSLLKDAISSMSDGAMLPPPPKRTRAAGPSMMPPSSMAMKPPREASFSRRIEPPAGTLSFLSPSHAKPHDDNQTEKGRQRPSVPSFDAKRDEWKAPKGQDGSGITKLNEKFAGRY